MTATLVGRKIFTSAGLASGTTVTVPLNSGLTGGIDSGASNGDLVICIPMVSSAGDATFTLISSGWTAPLAEQYRNDDHDANSLFVYKQITSDTDFQFSVDRTTADAIGCIVDVYRDHDTVTPLDVTPTVDGGTNSGRPNPPTLTPATVGAFVTAAGFGAAGTPANLTETDLDNFIVANQSDTHSLQIGIGTFNSNWVSGACDPAIWGGGGTNTTTYSWVGYTYAIRPIAPQTIDGSLFTNTNTFPVLTVEPQAVTVTGGLFTNTNAFYSATVWEILAGATAWSGAGTSNFVGKARVAASLSFSGAGSFTLIGDDQSPGVFGFSGEGIFNATATKVVVGQISFSSEGTFTAIRQPEIKPGAADWSATSDLVLTGHINKFDEITFDATSILSTIGKIAHKGSASFSGVGTSSLFTRDIDREALSFSSAGNFTALAKVKTKSQITFGGAGSISVAEGTIIPADFKKLSRDFGVEINPYRPDVPDEFRDLSVPLYEYLSEQASTLRRQHNITQAGDSTFNWEILTEHYDQQDYSLGSLGKFTHPTLGIFLARFVKFVNWDSALPSGSPCGRLTSPIDNLWHVTNQLIYSSGDLVVGLAGPYENDLESKFGWIIVDGVNIQSVYTDFDVTEQQSVGWIASGQLGVTKFRFGKVLPHVHETIEGRGFHIHPIKFVVDALASNTKDALIPPIDSGITTSIEELAGELNYFRNIINGTLDDISRTLNFDTAEARRSIQIIQGRLFSIDPGRISAQIQDSIYLVANFANVAEVAAANADSQSQFVTQTAYAANEFARRAEIAKTEAGIFAESATTMANTATLMRNDSIVYAGASATSASNAAASETAAGASATAASTSATTATTQAANASTSASQSSTSATAAAGSATSAAGSATAASTSATNAATSASNASTSASNASSSASTAGGHATSASASASTAVSAATTAGLNAAKTSQLVIRANNAENIGWTTAEAGDETLTTSPLSAGNIATIPGHGGIYYSIGSSGYTFGRAIFPASTGFVYNVEAEIYLSAAIASSGLGIRCVGLDANFNVLSYVDVTHPIGAVTGIFVRSTKFGVSADTRNGIVAWPANARYLRFGLAWNQSVGGTAGGIRSLSVSPLGVVTALNASVSTLALAMVDSVTGLAKAAFEVVTASGSATSALRLKSETSLGTYSSSIALEANELQFWSTNDSIRVLAGRISGGRSQWYGDMNVGGMIRIGTYGIPVALQAFKKLAGDGESVSFGADLQRLPTIEFDTTGLEPLASGESYDIRAQSLTSTGFTMYAKIISAGTSSTVSSGPGSNTGGTPSWQMDKSDASDATNGYYTVTVNMSVTPTSYYFPFGGGSFNVAYFAYDFYVRPGGTGSWILVGRYETYVYSGSNPTTANVVNAFYYADAIGQGAGTEFGIVPVSGTVNTFTSVTYPGITGSSASSATPSGQKVTATVRPQNIS